MTTPGALSAAPKELFVKFVKGHRGLENLWEFEPFDPESDQGKEIDRYELAHTARPDVDALVKALEAEAVQGETQARLFNSVDDSENANYHAKRAANLRTILARHAKGGATG